MRRTHGHGAATISVGNLIVDLSRNYAKINDVRLVLTAKEFWIVEFLALRKGAVLSKHAFLSHLYGDIDEPEPKIIDVFICKLRRKLVDAGADGLSIDTIWVQGYVLRETRNYAALKKPPDPRSSPALLCCAPAGYAGGFSDG